MKNFWIERVVIRDLIGYLANLERPLIESVCEWNGLSDTIKERCENVYVEVYKIFKTFSSGDYWVYGCPEVVSIFEASRTGLFDSDLKSGDIEYCGNYYNFHLFKNKKLDFANELFVGSGYNAQVLKIENFVI